MADTQAIEELATQLGEMVKGHRAVTELKSATQAFAADKSVQSSMAAFQKMLQTIGVKEQSGQPIEVAEKQQLRALQEAVVMNPQLQRMQVAQMDCVDLLRKIDAKVTGIAGLDEDAFATPGAPGGGGGGSRRQPAGAPGIGLG